MWEKQPYFAQLESYATIGKSWLYYRKIKLQKKCIGGPEYHLCQNIYYTINKKNSTPYVSFSNKNWGF